MGFIDPMVVGNAALTGVLEFNSWPTLWLLTAGLLSTAALAVGLAGPHLRRGARPAVPSLAHPQLAILGVRGAK